MKRISKQRGVIMPVVAGVILFIVFVGILYSFRDVVFVQQIAKEAELAHDVATRKFEDLMNLPFSHADLNVAQNPHVQGDLTWNVETAGPRLKKITIQAKLTHPVNQKAEESGQGVAFVGYRYDDF